MTLREYRVERSPLFNQSMGNLQKRSVETPPEYERTTLHSSQNTMKAH